MGRWPCWSPFCQWQRPIRPLCVTTPKSLVNFRTYKTTNRSRSVDAHFNVLFFQHLLPSIIVFTLISLYRLSFCLIETRPCGKAEQHNEVALFTLTRLKMLYHAKRFVPKDSLRLLCIYLWTNIHKRLLTIRPEYISNWNSRSSYIKLVNHWRILSYFVFPPLFLHVSTALTVTNNCSACLFDFRVGRTNPGTFGEALTSCGSGHSGSSMPLLCSISDSRSAAQSSSLSFGFSESPCQLSQLWVSEMLSGARSPSLSTGWRLILRIRRTFKIWVLPPGRSFADKAVGKGDLSDNLNAAAPSCWKSDQDVLTISSVSEMYPTAVICLFWARDSFWVARKVWLPSHISKTSWKLAVLGNFLSSVSSLTSESFSVLVVSNSASVPAKIALLAWANCLTEHFREGSRLWFLTASSR